MPKLRELTICSCKVTELDIESLISGATRDQDDTVKWKEFRRLNMGN